jgi:SAM-dependent methyltransferase
MPARDLSLQQAEILGTLLARILPGAWEGRVPPITVQGRHAVIDQYIKKNHWMDSTGKSMLDIGCGFPPVTTIETANYLSDWKVTGADPSMPAYLIYDEEGNYATLDENKSTVYFQPAIPSLENWNKLLSNSTVTRKRFERLLNDLLDHPNHEGFPRLEIDPIKIYQTERLSFIKGGIGQIEVEPKDVIRCFNVLYYFDNDFMESALRWFGEYTKEGGIVLIGGDWAASTECYYHVYQKKDIQLVNREFAFSLDCICPFGIVTWYAVHGGDRQKTELVKYISIIREDKSFMNEFYAFHDAQRLKYKMCPRDEQGYYGVIDPSIGPQELWALTGKMLTELNEAGLNRKAADVLRNAGLSASVNEVGHIAVEREIPSK